MRLFLLLVCAISILASGDDLESEVQKLRENSGKFVKQMQDVQAKIKPNEFTGLKEKIMKLASDERFLSAATQLWSHPNRNASLLSQLVFFILMIFIKGWIQSNAGNWLARIFIGLMLTAFTWVIMLYIIPAIIIGEPFRIVAAAMWKVFF